MADAFPLAETSKLRWRCRRGMRELDVLLERYLRERWPVASAPLRQAFAAVLELPDPDLAAYLLGRQAPPAELAAVLADITGRGPRELSGTEAVYPGDPEGGRLPGLGP